MKKCLILMLFITIGFNAFSQDAKIKWYTFQEAIELNKKEPRKIFIDVYTDWCGWCKKMDANTFRNHKIIKILNERFYAVKFNAEQKQDILFNGKTFKFIANGRRGYHELAAALLNNKLSYPSIAYLNEDNQLLTSVPGYQTPESLEPILMFLSEDAFKTETFQSYKKKFDKKETKQN